MADHEFTCLWRALPGYDGYEASTDGRIRSWLTSRRTRRSHPRILKPYLCQNGYLYVLVTKPDGTRKNRKTGAMVLEAWVGPRLPGDDVRHLDGNPMNNHLSNLAYGTRAQNMADARRHGTAPIGSKHGRAKLTEAIVRSIRNSTESHRILAEKFGVARSVIGHARSRRTWRHVA